ncbi:hypothetical protein BDR04DRAFT_1106604 [Suillus decipiens]|nr:hypothetical protein BDR04DRAFT_1106604 [Suillus decipiens]
MYPDVVIAQRLKSPKKITKSFLYHLLHIRIMLVLEDNIIRLELPLKYPETIRVTFIPDVPGPLTIEIIPSTCTTVKSLETPKEKALPQHLRTFIGPGIDNSPVKPSVPTEPIDDSVTEPESEVEQGALDVADKTVVNTSVSIKRPGSPLVSYKSRTTKY